MGKAEVLADGRPVGLRLAGRVLERQYALREIPATLLLITDDLPYEESLHLYLLGGVAPVETGHLKPLG